MLILVTGGSKCGKSRFAEAVISQYSGKKLYIATMQPFGSEAHEAIARHREMRKGKGFKTIEKYTDIHELDIPRDCFVLLECLGNLCANEMFSTSCSNPVEKIIDGITAINEKSAILVIVTNQVGDDGVEYSKETMRYIEIMGKLNQQLSRLADCVTELVFGIPVFIKGTLNTDFASGML